MSPEPRRCAICAEPLLEAEEVLRAGRTLSHASHWRGPEREEAAEEGRLYRYGEGPPRSGVREPRSLSALLDAIAGEALELGDVAVLELVGEAADCLARCAGLLGEDPSLDPAGQGSASA
jgi:hypothetical protein